MEDSYEVIGGGSYDIIVPRRRTGSDNLVAAREWSPITEEIRALTEGLESPYWDCREDISAAEPS